MTMQVFWSGGNYRQSDISAALVFWNYMKTSDVCKSVGSILEFGCARNYTADDSDKTT